MNFKVFLVSVVLLVQSFAFASTYKCVAPKNAMNAFLAGGYAIVTIEKQTLRFQQYDNFGAFPSLIRDYEYSFDTIAGGVSKVKGMMKFDLKKQIKSYGDALYTLYVDQALSKNANGSLIFSGHGYSWDWNYCKLQ